MPSDVLTLAALIAGIAVVGWLITDGAWRIGRRRGMKKGE